MTLSGELSAKSECRVGCQICVCGMAQDRRCDKRVMQENGAANVDDVFQVDGVYEKEEKTWGNRSDLSIGLGQAATERESKEP